MKIGHVLAYPYHGGIQEYVYNLVREQNKKHQITVFTSESNDIKYVSGVTYSICKPFLSLFRTHFIPSLITKLLKCDLDILHVHTPFPLGSDLTCLIGKIKKIPVVMTYHCEIELTSTTQSNILYKIFKSLHDNLLLPFSLLLTDKIIVTTQPFFETSKILEKHSSKIVVIPCGVDTNRFKPVYEYPKKILFVGRLIPEKGIDYLIKALQFVDYDLVIIGKPVSRAYYTHLVELTKELQLSSRVDFRGFVSDNELPQFYKQTGIVVLPSISRLEAFGLVIVEAFASGKPVIVTDIPGPSSLVKFGFGLVVPKKDSQALAKAIEKILENDNILKKCKEARKLVEREFSWSIVVNKINKLYTNTIHVKSK